jgi:L-amino acid N-acyltransferase YncA
MSTTIDPFRDYPKQADLGGEEIKLRLLTEGEAAALQTFFLGLSPADLLFLQRDPTDPAEIDAWLQEIAAGQTITLVAEAEDTLLGESTLRRSQVPWTRHVGTVRVITASEQRGRGLGRMLLEEMFSIAGALGIEKIVAEMTVEQVAAQRMFEQLGFREEGRYHAYIKDRRGAVHDLVVMTHDQPALDAGAPTLPQSVQAWRCHACGHVTPAVEQPPRCPDCGAAGEMLTPMDQTPPAG